MREREEVKGASVAVAPLIVDAAGAQEKKMHPLIGWDIYMYVWCHSLWHRIYARFRELTIHLFACRSFLCVDSSTI